jgi:hypothetical protein
MQGQLSECERMCQEVIESHQLEGFGASHGNDALAPDRSYITVLRLMAHLRVGGRGLRGEGCRGRCNQQSITIVWQGSALFSQPGLLATALHGMSCDAGAHLTTAFLHDAHCIFEDHVVMSTLCNSLAKAVSAGGRAALGQTPY